MDFLSKCSTLVEIMVYLDHEDICNFMLVSNRFYSVIRNNWIAMPKQLCDIDIIKGERNGASFLFFDFKALRKYLSDMMFRVQIFDETMIVASSAPQFLKCFPNEKYARLNRIIKNRGRQYIIEEKVTAIGSVFEKVLPRVTICHFTMKLESDDFMEAERPNVGTMFSEEEFNVILNGLINNCTKYSSEIHFKLYGYCPIYENIAQALGANKFKFHATTEYFELDRFNTENMNLQCCVTQWNVVRITQLIKEWRSGARRIKRFELVYIREYILDRLSFRGFQKLCEELQVQLITGIPGNKDELGCVSDVSYFQIGRDSDNRMLRVTLQKDLVIEEV